MSSIEKSKTHVIFIPSYNCADQISRVIKKFGAFESYQKIIIDNSSSDDTVDTAIKSIKNENFKNWVVLRNEQNYGLGGSFKLAVEYSIKNNVEYIVWFHGDDQVEIEDLTPMIETSLGRDVVFGSRFHPKSRRHNYSVIRNLGNLSLIWLVSVLLGKKISELGSGLNIYKTESLPLGEIPRWPHHIAFDMNHIFHFFGGNYLVEEYPIGWVTEDQVSNAGNIKTGLLIVWMSLKNFLGLKNLGHEQPMTQSEKFRC